MRSMYKITNVTDVGEDGNKFSQPSNHKFYQTSLISEILYIASLRATVAKMVPSKGHVVFLLHYINSSILRRRVKCLFVHVSEFYPEFAKFGISLGVSNNFQHSSGFRFERNINNLFK